MLVYPTKAGIRREKLYYVSEIVLSYPVSETAMTYKKVGHNRSYNRDFGSVSYLHSRSMPIFLCSQLRIDSSFF